MFEQEFPQHFNTIIAADAEATFQAFEMLLGRPIGEDEIEPRNAAYRRSGQALRRRGLPGRPGRGSGCGHAGWRTGGTTMTCC